ncbi:three rows [Cochliomyia hominivorax]
MDKDFETELKGSLDEAISAKQQIAKYFKRYGESGHQDAKKHQLIFASKIICGITKCDNKHVDIYCNIIVEIFANHLSPEISLKYWTLYVNCIRYFHYTLVEKKDFDKAALIYRHISSYPSKLQSTEISLTCINIYCYQLFLQNSLKAKNPELAVKEATEIVENLTKLFQEVLETNKTQNFQYPDVLKKTMSWLFPQNRAGTVYLFLKILPETKVKQMFQSLFNLYGRLTFEQISNETEIQDHAKYIIETLYILLQVDIMDKMQLQLGLMLLSYCRIENRLQSYKPVADSFLILYDYLKSLCVQQTTLDFHDVYSKRCERFKDLFDKYAKNVMNQSWYGDFLVLIFFIHSQLQNTAVFGNFWKQMLHMKCFKSMLQLFMEFMKLAPCISSETKLFTINCCTSTRKHVILSFAQVSLATFVFYCQNVNEEQQGNIFNSSDDDDSTDYYKETIKNNLLLIVNHAFKIIDKMDCIKSKSQDIDIILTRFKQATLNCKSIKQANTCIAICELFLKIKTKITQKDWTLLLRRLYKTAATYITNDRNIARDIQMCYITSMLLESELDIGQIRTQISIFYANDQTSSTTASNITNHENCLMYLYHNTTSLFKGHLDATRKKLLHWLESQHVIKYYKTNTSLLHSILKSSQTHYDFVIITRLAKLQTYAMAKISSIYKSLKSKAKEMNLSRLESLTYAHVCVMILNDMKGNQKIQIDSKDLCEEQLENLLMREEMSTFTIHNDLKYYKMAWEAFKAFEEFYEKFDQETISMDDAIIDWESILDDLSNLALCLQLSGYIEYSSHIWLLHYKCSCLIQDNFSALRGLAFFCEHSKFCDNDRFINLNEEIQLNFTNITQGLENLLNLQRQTYQNYILLAVLQIAHYYARLGRLTFAQILLQYVQEKHDELPERQGQYDIVMATMDAIKFRLLAKHFDEACAKDQAKTQRTTAEKLLLHRCLLREIEEILDRFHQFSFISSNDGLMYSILIVGLVQEMAECTVNRLCDNFINALFIATCKCTLQLGLALRFVQVMGMWMWVNLQMEYVDKAQTKLKLIEYVMGLKTIKELTEKKSKVVNSVTTSTGCIELYTPSHHNPGMEAIRRLAQVQLSPIKTGKLQLSPSHRNSDLKRYLKCNIDAKLLPPNEQIEWTFFMIGCLNARLYFLVEDYEQLEMFYERGNRWLQTRQNSFNKNYYKNIQLMAMQHCANFLRARRQYEKALQCLEYGITMCENMKFYIDAVYYVNFQLQLTATRKEMMKSDDLKHSQLLPSHSKLRRVLEFNISPENKALREQAKKEIKEKLLQNVMASGKKSTAIMRPLPSVVTASDCSSSKKLKTQKAICYSSSSSGSSSSIDSKMAKSKPKTKFEICEDSIEIIEIIEDVVNNGLPLKTSLEDEKAIKRTKTPDENDQLPKTPKTIKKSSKATTRIKAKRPELIQQYQIDIDLTDSLLNSPTKSGTSSTSSLENLETKENLNANELVQQMQNLEIKSCKKTKTLAEAETKLIKKRGRKPNVVKETDIVILEDSPCTIKSLSSKEVTDTVKSTRTRNNKENSPKEQQNNEDGGLVLTVAEGRPRRQRKLVLDTALTSAATTTPSITRRRQKNLV